MDERGTIGGKLTALLLGWLFSVFIWIAVPYNNFALNNSFISDGYLPEVVALFIALLVLVINPLLRLVSDRLALSHSQLAIITGVMLFAAVLPSNGLFRFFPHCVALNTQKINQDPAMAAAVADSDLPAALFPDEIGPDVKTSVSNQLVQALNPGEEIPWSAWLEPALAWGFVILAFWMMMVGLGAVVYPQWRRNERLPFPLLKVYHSMIDEPEKGYKLPPVFRSKLFWAGCSLVFILHSFNGLALFTDEAFPSFPISWDISGVFTEGVWVAAPGFLKHSKIYFLFFGMAYFMSNRYSFSIWVTVLFFGLVVMMARTYWPWFDYGNLYDQGCGALIAITLGVLWLGRHHYARVFGLTFRRNAREDDKTDASAGRTFLVGCLLMFAWFVWAGAGLLGSLFFVAISVMVMMLVARVVAETGLTYLWIIPLTASRFISFLPNRFLNVSLVFLKDVQYVLANRASAVSVAVMMTLTLGLNRSATPKTRRTWVRGALVVLVLGFVVCGLVHLHMGYNLSTSFDGKLSPITGRGARLMSLNGINNLIVGRTNETAVTQIKFIIWGMLLAGALLFLCARFPSWPLHPIGLLFVHSSIGLRLFWSFFLGWCVKKLIVRFGGARSYRAATPLFLGLIIGEVFANVFWTLVPVLQIVFGADPRMVEHMIIFQYT